MKKLIYLFSIIIFISSCDIIKNKEVAPESRFSRIFDNSDFETTYYAQDIKQTADGGYLILGGAEIESSEFLGIYLMKLDGAGNFMWDLVSDAYVNPVSELMSLNGDEYIVAMTPINPSPQLLRVGEQELTALGDTLERVGEYPLAASLTSDGRFLVLGYDRSSRRSRLYKTGNDEAWNFDVFEDTNPTQSGGVLYSHLTRKRKPLPFFVGEANGVYYFNGFNNYNLALTFVNPATGEQQAVMNGNRYDAAVSALLPLEGGLFALSHYKVDGENEFAPRATINTGGGVVDGATVLDGFDFPDLTKNAKVVIKRAVVKNIPVLLYLSDTKNGQIKLSVFEEASGLFINSRIFGEGNAFEIGGMSVTNDEGLAIVGRTFVVGRFPRICVFKLDKEELEALIP